MCVCILRTCDAAHFPHTLMSIRIYEFTMFVNIICEHIHSIVLLISCIYSCQYDYMDLLCL